MSDGSILEFSEDLKDAEAPTSLPAGDYTGEVVAAENGTSANSGKDRAAVTFRIKPEDYPADYEDANEFPDGKQVTFYVGTEDTKPARFRLRKFMEAIGVAPKGKKIDVNEWIGKTAILEIIPDEYEGIERERIKHVKSA